MHAGGLTCQPDAGRVSNSQSRLLRVKPADQTQASSDGFTMNKNLRLARIKPADQQIPSRSSVWTHLMTGTSGPKVSSFVHSMSAVTSASRVGSMKEPSRRFPPFTTFAPRDTASEI